MTVVMSIAYDTARLEFLFARLGPLVPESKTIDSNLKENELVLTVFGGITEVIPDGVLMEIGFFLIDDGSLDPIFLEARDASAARTDAAKSPA